MASSINFEPDRLRQARQLAVMTKKEVADIAGVSAAAVAPCSLARSCRIGCTLTTVLPADSCTEPATIATCRLRPAQARPARYMVPANETAPVASAMRVTVGPDVA